MEKIFKKRDFINMLSKYKDFQAIQNDLEKYFGWEHKMDCL